MVKLDKIYTRGGDKGKTSLANAKRVDKNSLRIITIGEVDEVNAMIGLAMVSASSNNAIKKSLELIQNDLFDFGADIAMPYIGLDFGRIRMEKIQVERLEKEIDFINKSINPLDSFVLPGGTELSSRLHVARTVIRRAERSLVTLSKKETVNSVALEYLNRLSDLMFVMARSANNGGQLDILWQPKLSTK